MEQELPSQKQIIIQNYNKEKLKIQNKLQKYTLGKGKIAKTIDGLLVGGAALLEIIRGLPGFEYLNAATVGNLTTKFNAWLASILTKTPDLTGLTPEQIFELGKHAQQAGTDQMANSWGLLFSSVVEFVLQHPSATAVGIAAVAGVLAVPFKALIKKLKEHKLDKIDSNIEKIQGTMQEEQPQEESSRRL